MTRRKRPAVGSTVQFNLLAPDILQGQMCKVLEWRNQRWTVVSIPLFIGLPENSPRRALSNKRLLVPTAHLREVLPS